MLSKLFRRGGLRTRIITWFLVPTLLLLIAVALVTSYTYERVTEELVTERNRELTQLLAEQLTNELDQYPGVLQSFLAAHPHIFEYDLAARQALLRESIGRLIAFDGGVVLLDRAGIVVAADRYPLSALGQDWSGRPGVGRTLQVPQPHFSDIETTAAGDEVLFVIVPALDEDRELAGLMLGAFRLEPKMSAFYRSILKLRLYGDVQDERTIYLVDRNGRAIHHSDVGRIGERLSNRPPVRQVLKNRGGALRTQNIEGQEIVASFAPLPGMGWGLVIQERWAALTAVSQGYRRLLLALLALIASVPLLVVAWGARRITRPLADLTDAAQEMAGGHLSQTIDVHTGDELEALAEQFNRMAAQLQASYATLEQRVQDRTRELATLNAITATVSRSLELDEILHDALDKTLEIMNMEAGGAFRLDENGERMTLIAHHGLSDPFVAQAAHLPLAASLTGQAARAKRPVVRAVADYTPSALKSALQSEGLAWVISIPLIAKGQVLGSLNLASRTLRAVTPEELALLAAVGQQVGVAVENARLYEQAEQSAVAAERNRLARELHDAVTQTLFSASLIAEILPRLWERHPKEAARRLNELRELTRGALAEMRTLLLELRPTALAEAELGELLRQLAESVTGRARVPVKVQINHEHERGHEGHEGFEGELGVPLEVKIALYRIAQEALNNVAKHAEASQATVSLRCLSAEGDARGCRRLELHVRDDGRGFDVAQIPPDHLGVGIMRERADAVGATLQIESQVGQGTAIIVTWEKDSTQRRRDAKAQSI